MLHDNHPRRRPQPASSPDPPSAIPRPTRCPPNPSPSSTPLTHPSGSHETKTTYQAYKPINNNSLHNIKLSCFWGTSDKREPGAPAQSPGVIFDTPQVSFLSVAVYVEHRLLICPIVRVNDSKHCRVSAGIYFRQHIWYPAVLTQEDIVFLRVLV